MKTRSKKPATSSKSQQNEIPKTTLKTLEASVETPPKLFILPKDASPNARILTLPNPATLQPNRYFACPDHGFYEFTRVTAPKKACRSWLLAPDKNDIVESDANYISKEEPSSEQNDEGYILQTPDLFVATPIDPAFLVLPTLWPAVDGSGVRRWATLHDRLFLDGPYKAQYVHLQHLLNATGGETLERTLERRMRTVCDVRDMAGEAYYALNEAMLGKVIWKKAQRVVEVGLPASLEETFVKQALQVPVLSVRREESDISLGVEEATGGAENESAHVTEASQESSDTLASNDATSTPATSFSTEITSAPTSQVTNLSSAPTSVIHLLRLRTALNFILASYTNSDLREKLLTQIYKPEATNMDFHPLDDHLKYIEKIKNEAQALRAISDNVSRKRGVLDDEEALQKAEVKKRKKEEEEAKKKNVSQGVKKLMKADTSGMKKLSSFFAKAPAKNT